MQCCDKEFYLSSIAVLSGQVCGVTGLQCSPPPAGLGSSVLAAASVAGYPTILSVPLKGRFIKLQLCSLFRRGDVKKMAELPPDQRATSPAPEALSGGVCCAGP